VSAVFVHFRFFASVIGLVLALHTAGAQAQAPIPVSPCELIAHPEEYAGKIVKVRAKVSIAFEDFTLATAGCDEKSRQVWLMYGGDEPTPTMSTVNDQSRPAGSVLRVEGRPVVLKHDAQLELFKRRLSAVRLTGVSDDECSGNCRFYNVTATLTGIFFAAPDRPLGGFGHMWCCHLLAIQQIEDVDAERTRVPAGGQYSCTTDTWKVPEAEIGTLERRQCSGFEDCNAAALQQVKVAASHWNDPLSEAADGDLSASWGPIWHSSDLLKTYSVEAQSSKREGRSDSLTAMTVSRTLCRVVSPPLPMSAPIGCRNLRSEFPPAKNEIEQIQSRVRQGQDQWRLGSAASAAGQALEEASRKWGITLAQGLIFSGCDNPMIVAGDQFSSCHWVDPDGMQALSVQVTRFGSLRSGKNWDSVPWVLTRGRGQVCAAGE
jgi:hypothetical protein